MLRSEKVYLRRLERSDLENSLLWINNPQIMVIMGVFGPRTALEQEQWYESVAQSRKNLVFAICLVNNSEHIGNISLFDIDYINRNAGLSIFIAAPEHQGRGYGTEAVKLIVEYAFTYLNLHKVYSKTDRLEAVRLYEQIGFMKEGVLRKHEFKFGEYIDKIVYGLLSSEYRRGEEQGHE